MRKTGLKNYRSDQSRGVDLFRGNPSNTATLFFVVSSFLLFMFIQNNSFTQFCLPSVVSNEQVEKSSEEKELGMISSQLLFAAFWCHLPQTDITTSHISILVTKNVNLLGFLCTRETEGKASEVVKIY